MVERTEPVPAKPARPGDGQTPASPGEAIEAIRALARASRVLERASGGLSLAHYRVLAAIASGNERASRIATRLALGKPTVSTTVEALCRRGLLLRAEAQGDQRAVALRLTPAGRSLLEEVEADMVRRIDDLFARTPDPAATKRALAWLGAAMDVASSDRSGTARPRGKQASLIKAEGG